MLTTPAEPSDQHHIEVQRLSCARARKDSQDVTRCWDMIFCSVRLAGGCSTGISFEVGSTTLLIPPGERRHLAGEEHVLQSWKHMWACSSPIPAVSYSHCFPSHPSLVPVLQVKSCLGKACPPLWVIVAVETVHPHSPFSHQFSWVRLCSRTCKNVHFCIQGFFF